MARFFLALRVGRQHVAVALPDVAQPLQLAADRVVGQPQPGAALQVLSEDGDRPVHRGVAQLVGALAEAGPQQRLQVIGPQARAARAVTVPQGGGPGGALEGAGTVVDALAGDAQRLGDVGDGLAPVEFEDGQQPAIVTGVVGDTQLGLKALTLRRS